MGLTREDVKTSAPAQEQVLPAAKGAGLGTFGGVFTPSILTILGVIMYLRLGWVVGHVGAAAAVLIISLSTGITLLTALSIAEIATDQRVRTGGAYYMISRSLGIETGGAVGIPLYLAQGLSVALYTVGFAESLADVLPQLDQRWTGIGVTILVALLALASPRIAIRAQYLIMGAIGVSLVSFLLGRPLEATDFEALGGPPERSLSFWPVFAVFFPAVTGIMAGVNMSGDLRDPARSIPRGTLAAVAVGYAVYVGIAVVLATKADAETLVADPMVMRRIAFWGDGILLGVWGATLSSAVGSILGAPRVLQALARDGVLPRSLRWLGSGSGPDDVPRAGTVVTLALALGAVAVGDLNLIAPVLTMFFLTTYGVLNVAAGLERFLGSPSFRPRFRVHWSLSLAGAVGCAWVMLLINAVATVVAAAVVVGIFIWLERRELTTAWGDVRKGIWMALVRAGLLRLREPMDPKNWRPHMMVLAGAPARRWHLIDLAAALSHGRGLITVASVVGSENVEVDVERRSSMESAVKDHLEKRGITCLVRVVVSEDRYQAIGDLVASYGLGQVAPNTILVGDSGPDGDVERYAAMVRRLHELRRNVVIVHESEEGYGERRRIDVWWGGLQRNGGLMLILGHLVQTSLRWRGAELVLRMAVGSESAAEGCRDNLSRIVAATRIDARIEVLVAQDRSFHELLHEFSADTDLVLLGVAEPRKDFPGYLASLRRRVEGLPSSLLILAAEDLEFGEILVERPQLGE